MVQHSGKRKFKAIAFGLVGMFPLFSTAQQNDDLWLKCAEVVDPSNRLACFDSVANNTLKNRVEVQPESHVSDDVPLPTQTANTDTETSTPLTHAAENRQLLAEVGVTENILEEYTPLSRLYDLDSNDGYGLLTLRAHNPNYIMPIWHNSERNKAPHTPSQPRDLLYDGKVNSTETKFQISFKTKIWEDVLGTRSDLWFGYTQQSYWQVYNRARSSPFRGSNYEPEIFLTQPVSYSLPFNGKLRMLGVGAVHQSNGEDDPLSRSWNRVYAMAGMEWGKLTVVPRIWYRVPERKKSDDDNPDIVDYIGYGDLSLSYQFGRQAVASTFTYNPMHGKGGVRLEYVFPIYNNLKGYVQYFEGYGENLLDYNHHNRSIGLGVMLYDWGGL